MVRLVTGRQRAAQHPQGTVSHSYAELGSGARNEAMGVLTCGLRPPLWSHQQDMPTNLVHTRAPEEKHTHITIPQPWSSFLALLIKYVWHIKIIVQTEGLTVAQSRPGECLNHSVGGVTARGGQQCARGGKRNYSRKWYRRKQFTYFRVREVL